MIEDFMRTWLKDALNREPMALAMGIGLLIVGATCSWLGTKLAWVGSRSAMSLGWKTVAWTWRKMFGKREMGQLAWAIFRAHQTQPICLHEENKSNVIKVGKDIIIHPWEYIMVDKKIVSDRLTKSDLKQIYREAYTHLMVCKREKEANETSRLTCIALYGKEPEESAPLKTEIASTPYSSYYSNCTCENCKSSNGIEHKRASETDHFDANL